MNTDRIQIHPQVERALGQIFQQRFWRVSGLAAVACYLTLAVFASGAAAPAAPHSESVARIVTAFESHYSGVHSLQADFKQTAFAWGKARVESGVVYMAQGGRMRWVYEKPDKQVFISDGRQLLFYVPAQKQLTISSAHDAQSARVPLGILLSHVQLSKLFSRVELANGALETPRGHHVLRGYPRFFYKNDFRSVVIDLAPNFDIRRLVVFYPDNSTMQFEFTAIQRNPELPASLFAFSPPPGTQVIHQ